MQISARIAGRHSRYRRTLESRTHREGRGNRFFKASRWPRILARTMMRSVSTGSPSLPSPCRAQTALKNPSFEKIHMGYCRLVLYTNGSLISIAMWESAIGSLVISTCRQNKWQEFGVCHVRRIPIPTPPHPLHNYAERAVHLSPNEVSATRQSARLRTTCRRVPSRASSLHIRRNHK
jgi:hypothetical protein